MTSQPTTYVYFVYFTVRNGDGNTVLHLDKQPVTKADIDAMTTLISDAIPGHSVTISNFKLLATIESGPF